MSNPFDNADNDRGKNAEQDSAQKTGHSTDHPVFLSENETSDPHAVSTTHHPSEPMEGTPAADNAPGISHFLKYEAGAESHDTNTLDTAGVVQSVGHMLRKARIARKMSIEDVSRQLRISALQIDAIEKEDFDRLPGRTFVRGFVRNYANLMHLDANAAVQMLPGSAGMVTHAAHVEHTPFKIKEMSLSSRERKGGGNLLQVIILLAVLAAAGFFGYNQLPFWQITEESDSDDSAGEQVVQQGDGQTSIELKLVLPSLLNPGGGAVESVVTQNAMTNLNTIGTLAFNVKADTHIKVIDGNDDVIFDQNNARRTQPRVSGKRPLSVTIGKASAVELHYNDRAIDLSPYTHPAKGSAHLMLE